jgi:predicted ester cyclase
VGDGIVNDEYLKQFRKEPSKEFADGLHAKLARQPQPRVLMPNLSRDGWKRKRDKRKEGDEMNGTVVLPLPGARSYPLRGYLVVLVATLAAVLVSTVLILNRIGTVSNSLYWLAQEDANRALVERYITQIWNEGKVQWVGDLVMAEHVHHDTTLAEPVVGVEALIAYVEKCRADLPDLTFEIDDLRTEGERMVADLRAVGEGVDVPLTASVRIVEGKLAETWFDVNALVTNAEVEAAWEPIEAANLALNDQFVEYLQKRAELVQDRATYEEWHKTLFKQPYSYHELWANSRLQILGWADDYSWDRNFTTAFPDYTFTVESVAAHHDLVFVHHSGVGSFENAIDLQGRVLKPTGKQMVESGVLINRYEGGKIVEMWYYINSPIFWVGKALFLQGGSADLDAQDIYNANKPE